MQFAGSHILSIAQFERPDVEQLFAVADRMQPYAHRRRATKVLDGAILGAMFFEPSTRTRVSFGSAFNLLGGEVRETTGHPQEGSVAEFAAASRVPVLNGGDGSNEHPTQALLDLYTIKKELAGRGRGIDQLRIAMVGDLRFGRTVHSLCKLLCLFDGIQVVLVSPEELRMPPAIVEQLRTAGHQVLESEALEASISNVDIVYSTRIQEERFSSQQEADLYRGRFRLNQSIYTEHCEPNTVIMHPLPRELDDDLNDNPNLAIFRQTDNGVLVRMALFALVLDVADQVDSHARDVNWYTGGRFDVL